MIIPFTETYPGPKVKPGDKVVVIRNIQGPYYVILTGQVMTYLGTESGQNPGEMLKDEETGFVAKHISILDYQIYQPSLEKARKIYIDKKEEQKFIKIIKSFCPYYRAGGCYNTERRKEDNNECSVECIEYVKEDKYKDNEFVLNYIRKLKLNELQKEKEI